jgi:leader peptidase (prepilin peptidase)/N-methyltransferase
MEYEALKYALYYLLPVLGLLTGSFLNVCIYRMPRGESIIFPSSRCTRCNTRLRADDMVPVLSHLFLMGRCRYCGTSVSFRYSFVEILTAVCFLAVYATFGIAIETVIYTVVICGLIVISFIDLDVQIIPDEISIGGTVLGIITGILVSVYPGYGLTGYTIGITDSLLGFSAGFFLLYVISAATRGGMGGGDVKLAGMLGSFLGAKGVLITLLLASFIGAPVGVFLIATGIKGRKDLVPFGPYIALGAVIVIFMGADGIVSRYMEIFSP